MKFVIFVIDSNINSATDAEMANVNAFNDQLRSNGNWVLGVGLGAPHDALLIEGRDENSVAVSGSLNDGPEFYSGFWIIETDSRASAEELANKGSSACNRRVELRELFS